MYQYNEEPKHCTTSTSAIMTGLKVATVIRTPLRTGLNLSLCKWSDLLEKIQSLPSSSSYLPTHIDSQDILRTSYILWHFLVVIQFYRILVPFFWEFGFSFGGRRRSSRQAYIWRPTQRGVHRFTKYFYDTYWSWSSFIGFGFPFHPDFWWFGLLLIQFSSSPFEQKDRWDQYWKSDLYWGGHI